MKRITKLNLLNLILFTLSCVLNIIQLKTNLFIVGRTQFCFVMFLIFVGISLFYKFILFKSDSSLWLSITLVGFGVNMYLFGILNLNYKVLATTFLISPIIASLFVGHIFKDVLQLKVVVYLIIMALSIYLFSFKIVEWYYGLIIFVLAEILVVILFRYLPKIFNSIRGRYG